MQITEWLFKERFPNNLLYDDWNLEDDYITIVIIARLDDGRGWQGEEIVTHNEIRDMGLTYAIAHLFRFMLRELKAELEYEH